MTPEILKKIKQRDDLFSAMKENETVDVKTTIDMKIFAFSAFKFNPCS